MSQIQISKPVYDLEERTQKFSSEVLLLCKGIPSSLENNEIRKQLTRSSCSVGANYIEANECLGKKDFLMRIRICRKEAKESRYWLELLHKINPNGKTPSLSQEALELTKIFGTILTKSS